MGVTGLAVWVLVSEHIYLNTGWGELTVPIFVVLAIGLLMSLLAFLACCGSITSSKCLLGMFVISLLAVLVGQVSLAVLLYCKELDYRSFLREGVHEMVTKKYHPNNTATVLYWDTIQQGFSCCGSSGPTDWAHSL